MRYQEINELRRWQSPQVTDDYDLIAFRGNYWMLPPHGEIPDQVVSDIATHIGMDMENFDAGDLQYTLDDRPDVILGRVQDNELYLRRNQMSVHAKTSSMIKKLVKDLGLQGVNTTQYADMNDEDAETYHSKHEIEGSIPDTLFHGTHSGYLQRIAKIGLRPNQVKSNWEEQGISHPKLIFGAAGMNDTIFHANRTAGATEEEYYIEDPDTDFPVVIEFKIPNKDLVVPDYDVAAYFLGYTNQTANLGYEGSRNYGRTRNDDVIDNNPEGKIWKAAGVYGYQGWIPPSYITRVYTNFFDGKMDSRPSWHGTLPEFFEMLEQQTNEYFGHEEEDDWE